MKKVGYIWEVPEFEGTIVSQVEIGGYTITAVEGEGMMITGGTTRNITIEPIETIEMLPVTAEKYRDNFVLKEGQDFSKTIPGVYEIEEGRWYVQFTYGYGAYIFDNIEEALTFSGAILSIKTIGMQFYKE